MQQNQQGTPSENLSQFNKFLKNNEHFLNQKFVEHFANLNCVLGSISINNLIKYIYDIFGFNKYQHDEVMNNKILDSLTINAQSFNKLYSQTLITKQLAISLLSFCIKNNDLFSIQYDLTEKNTNYQSNHQQIEITKTINGKNDTNTKNMNEYMLQKINQNQNIELSESQLLRQEGNNASKVANREMDSDYPQNEFTFHQKPITIKHIDEKQVYKNARILFNFYCKQQMSIGVNNTFDRLQYQGSTMNLSSCIFFGNSVNLFNQQITKNLLVTKFKKISDGKKRINFQTFYMLLNQLQAIDPLLFQRLKLDEQIPRQEFKNRRFAFNTQDQNPREFISIRKFAPKENSISINVVNSSISQALQNQKGKSLQIINSKKIRYQVQDIKVLNVKDLEGPSISSKKQLIYLRKMVVPQQNDEVWLKEYKLKLPKRLSKQESDLSILTEDYSSKQDRIVKDLKRRVNEISKVQDKEKNDSYLRKRQNLYKKQIQNNFIKLSNLKL